MSRNYTNLGRSVVAVALMALSVSGCLGAQGTEESGEGLRRRRICGGWVGDTCRGNQYCAYEPDAMCGAADASGVCMPRPQVCTEQYDPVCGCNGETYGNACFAASAGVSVAYEGECAPPEPRHCGGHLGLTCEEGEYCAYTTEQMCGAADHLGTCAPRPEACIQLYDPVCGCDGQTHSNACMAANAGTSVAYAGECAPPDEEIFCGGIAGLPCPDGMTCELDGDYPDAGGHCVAAPTDCRQDGCPEGWACVNCWGGPTCLAPDMMCAF